ncbi:type II secretion system GspH family protein [Patescibacteria group bacterium]|nr:type II secretion system GspH family protein [Patescibacteria group bacterium]
MKQRGFTLIELMVVISVIAILSTIALFGLNKAQASARDSSRQQIMNGIRTALERYYGDNQFYPGPGGVGYQWSGASDSPIDTLVTGKYLVIPPKDPCKNGTTIPSTGTMGASDCAPTAYAYTATQADGSACTTADKNCTKYTLTLTKEAGGTSIFVSPQ